MSELPQIPEDEDQKETSEERSPEPQTFSTERKVARKFIQGTAQSLIQWMPLGGSGGLLISFLLRLTGLKINSVKAKC